MPNKDYELDFNTCVTVPANTIKKILIEAVRIDSDIDKKELCDNYIREIMETDPALLAICVDWDKIKNLVLDRIREDIEKPLSTVD